MKDAISELVDISHFAARHPDWIQGGGGNCSVKIGENMLIKASGFLLEDVSEDSGFVCVDQQTQKPIAADSLKPSMESPLHSLLNTYVIHTHPILVGGLVCAAEGPGALRTLFPEDHVFWIDYATPGQPLYERIKLSQAHQFQDQGSGKVLFLQNHGLFVSAGSKDQAKELHQWVMDRLGTFFGEIKPASPTEDNVFLSPDHVVYLAMEEGNLSGKQIKARSELLEFSRCVLNLIASKGWQVSVLKKEAVKELLNMDEEKYRQQLWNKP